MLNFSLYLFVYYNYDCWNPRVVTTLQERMAPGIPASERAPQQSIICTEK